MKANTITVPGMIAGNALEERESAHTTRTEALRLMARLTGRGTALAATIAAGASAWMGMATEQTGWLVLSVALLALFAASSDWRDTMREKRHSEREAAGNPGGLFGDDEELNNDEPNNK